MRRKSLALKNRPIRRRTMSDKFFYIDEPLLSFGFNQSANDPHDGLALFGPSDVRNTLPDNIVLGTSEGIGLWSGWCAEMNASAACVDVKRHRAWPPFPGFDVAFGAPWPAPSKTYQIDRRLLSEAARKSDKYDRAFAV